VGGAGARSTQTHTEGAGGVDAVGGVLVGKAEVPNAAPHAVPLVGGLPAALLHVAQALGPRVGPGGIALKKRGG